MRRILTPSIIMAILWMPSPSAYGVSSRTARVLAIDVEPALSAPRSTLSRVGVVHGPPVSHIPVSLYNVNSRESRTFILTREGELVGDDKKQLERFFRCKRSGRRHAMAPRVLGILAEVAAEYPDHVIEIVSGYRRRGYGVKRSKHFTGHAIDLRVRGVSTSRVRDFVWGGQHDDLGVGHYRGGNFLHVDHRPSRPKVGWTQRRRNSRYRYNPRWARVDTTKAAR